MSSPHANTHTSGLCVQGLTTGYPRRPVLHGLNLAPMPPGTLAAVVGPNAVGKSTLLKAIAGLRPSTGQVWLDGADLGQLPARRRLHQIGYLPQALPQASSLLAYEAMQGALRVGRPDLDRTGVEAAIEHIFSTLDLQHLAMRRLDELSGGQRQMVGLAQVVVREPRLMLLDEPTSALDLRWQLQVLQMVRALVDSQQGMALVALHDLNLALRFCNHLIVLGGGQVLAAGAPAEVFTPALLEQAYGVRARVERCSQGHLMVLVDEALPSHHTL